MEINTKEFICRIEFPGFSVEAFWSPDGPVVLMEHDEGILDNDELSALISRALTNFFSILELHGYSTLGQWEEFPSATCKRYSRTLQTHEISKESEQTVSLQ